MERLWVVRCGAVTGHAVERCGGLWRTLLGPRRGGRGSRTTAEGEKGLEGRILDGDADSAPKGSTRLWLPRFGGMSKGA